MEHRFNPFGTCEVCGSQGFASAECSQNAFMQQQAQFGQMAQQQQAQFEQFGLQQNRGHHEWLALKEKLAASEKECERLNSIVEALAEEQRSDELATSRQNWKLQQVRANKLADECQELREKLADADRRIGELTREKEAKNMATFKWSLDERGEKGKR